MNNSDLVRKIQYLKKIKPNQDWAVSVRANLVRIADEDTRLSTQRSEATRGFYINLLQFFTPAKLYGAFAFVVVSLMVVSTMAAQRSLPGSPLYSVKIAIEDAQTVVVPGESRKADLRVAFTGRRVEEVSQLAFSKLETEEIAVISETLDNYREDIQGLASLDEADPVLALEKVAVIRQQTSILTAAINQVSPSVSFKETLRVQIEERLEGCANDGLVEDVQELLNENDTASLIEAFELSVRCSDSE